MNEIDRWFAQHSVWGKVLHYNLPIEKLKKINERLNCAFAISGTAYYFIPLITKGRERATVASKTTTVNNKQVDKTCIVLLYMRDVQPEDRFFGWDCDGIASEVSYVLQRNGISDEDEDLTIGVDFETELYSQLRYQTFLLNKSGVVEKDGKIRIAICFDNPKQKDKGVRVLRKAAQEDRERYPWRVYELKPKDHYTYFDTDIFSMMSHWLTDMNLDGVVCIIYYYPMINLFYQLFKISAFLMSFWFFFFLSFFWLSHCLLFVMLFCLQQIYIKTDN